MEARGDTRIIQASVFHGDEEHSISGKGNGPIDAFVDGLKVLGVQMEVVDYHEHAASAGSDATAIALVEARFADGRTLWGAGSHKDIVTACLRAVLSAANRSSKVAT